MAGLYIHIPFCHAKCAYCDFYSVATNDKVDRVVDGLIKEFVRRRFEIEEPFHTIYLGGGTPSVLSGDHMARLFETLPVNKATEITIEVNPEDVNPSSLDTWKHLGINRISMGVQSLDDDSLKWLGRRHSADDARRAMSLIRSRFDNMSVDFIYGFHGLNDQALVTEIREAIDLGATHLSAYCLTFHEGTPLYRRLHAGEFTETVDEDIEKQFFAVHDFAETAGFEHYEISNFARPGLRSQHNSAYWNPSARWLGIGPSAHSFDGATRRIDHPDVDRWLATIPEPFEIDEENEIDLVNDNIVTALRTSDGLDLSHIPTAMLASLIRKADKYINRGMLLYTDKRLSIPYRYWLISDAIIRDLMLD